MILSNQQIADQLGRDVIIAPYRAENVNTSSVDVTLGEWYYIEQHPPWWRRLVSLLGFYEVYNIWDADHVARVWGEPHRARVLTGSRWTRYRGVGPGDQVIRLPPRTTILAHTAEFIGGRRRVTTMMKARSSMGRNFIEVCKCAGYGDVGYTNRWTMEITNNSRWRSVLLVVGRRIAQIVFMETGPLADDNQDYTSAGKYQDAGAGRDQWRPSAMLPKLHLDRDVYRAR